MNKKKTRLHTTIIPPTVRYECLEHFDDVLLFFFFLLLYKLF